MTDIIGDLDPDFDDHPRDHRPPTPWTALTEPAALAIAGIAMAALSLLSSAPAVVAQMFVVNATSPNAYWRAQAVAMGLVAAVGVGLGLVALRRSEASAAPAWVRHVAAAAMIIGALVLLICAVTFVVAIAKDSPFQYGAIER